MQEKNEQKAELKLNYTFNVLIKGGWSLFAAVS